MDNNYIEIILDLYQINQESNNFYEKLQAFKTYLEQSTIFSGIKYCFAKEQINQKLFLDHLLKKDNFFNVYRRFQEMNRVLFQMSRDLKYEPLFAYFCSIKAMMDSLLTTLILFKISAYFGRPQEALIVTDAFLSDTSDFPISSLLGIHTYENPIIRLTFDEDDLFSCHDLMCMETVSMKDYYWRECLSLPILEEELKDFLRQLAQIDAAKYPNVMIYRQMYFDVFNKINEKKKRTVSKKRVPKKDDFEYYGSIFLEK